MGRVLNNTGRIKGGKPVIVSNVNCIRLRNYMHPHKLHIMPTGWTIMGQLEVRKMNLMQNMVEGEEGGAEDIYIEHIYYTWDNHFSGDRTMNWLG